MNALIFTLIFIVLGLLVAWGSTWLLYTFLSNFQPGSRKVARDFEAMRAEIQPWVADLLPWGEEEWALLSPKRARQVLRRGIVTTAKGLFTSIYDEPLVAYSYRRYAASGNNAVLFIRTREHSFAYRILPKETSISVDGKPLGTLRPDGLLYGTQRRLLGRIRPDEEGLALRPIVVQGREVGSLVDPARSGKLNPRAFELLDLKTAEEKTVFLALALHEMLHEAIGR